MRRLVVASVLALASALLAALAGLIPFARVVELKSYDWRMRLSVRPDAARDDIVLVRIDEISIRKLEPVVGRWPWPRLVHAEVIDFLARGPAKVIAYDVLFTERDRRRFDVDGETWTGDESDQALVEATRRAGTLVHVADVAALVSDESRAAGPSGTAWTFTGVGGFEERPSMLPPFSELARASRAIGHNLVVLDADGPLRRAIPFVRVGAAHVPSLPFAAAMLASGWSPASVRTDRDGLWLGSRRLPIVDQQVPSLDVPPVLARRALINFQGPVVWKGRTTYREHSFYDLFYAEAQIRAGETPLVDPALFRDRIVFVGTTAPGLHDLFTVPPAGGAMPGMVVHANVADNLLSSGFVGPAPLWADLAALALAVAVASFVTVLAGTWVGLAAAVVAAASLGGLSVLLFRGTIWLSLVVPIVGLVIAAFGGVSYQYVVEGREKRKVKRLFSRFVSKDVYEHLLADPRRATLGGERREMSVLFADIRGFTTLSEAGTPEAVVQQLNEYFTRMVRVVFAHRGTLDKFVGDMVMALFGAPLDDLRHAEHAVEAALAMLDELDCLNREWALRGLPPLEIGIGISTGEMVAGLIGAEAIMSYTVIGDAVNLGARLEALNKEHGTRVIVGETTRASLAGRYDIRALGEVVVKGKTRPVAIYEVRRPVAAVSDAGRPVGDQAEGGMRG